jgi:hypothetical protein
MKNKAFVELKDLFKLRDADGNVLTLKQGKFKKTKRQSNYGTWFRMLSQEEE